MHIHTRLTPISSNEHTLQLSLVFSFACRQLLKQRWFVFAYHVCIPFPAQIQSGLFRLVHRAFHRENSRLFPEAKVGNKPGTIFVNQEHDCLRYEPQRENKTRTTGDNMCNVPKREDQRLLRASRMFLLPRELARLCSVFVGKQQRETGVGAAGLRPV